MKHWISIVICSLVLLACAEGGTMREGGFAGIGEGHVTASQGILRGEVKYHGTLNGELVVEARSSFPCSYGRCPVIEKAPLGQERLNEPGPFALSLKDVEENLILIATYQDKSGKTLVAHELVPDPKNAPDSLVLSLDRPYAPLR